jgi:tetratricopeptide (TPR) repeat protein
MAVRTALVLILFLSKIAGAQNETPLFLDTRPGENPSVIDVTELTAQYPKAAVEAYEKGIDEARKGNRPAAIERLEAAITIEPSFFNAHNSLAILYHRMKQYRDAQREYREASRLNQRSAAPLVNLASLFIEEALSNSIKDDRAARGMLNEALASLNDAFRIQPGLPLAHYYTGMVYYLTSFYEESEDNFKKALASNDRRMVVSRLALADIYIRLQEWESAVAELEAYLHETIQAPNRQLVRSTRDAILQKLQPTPK